MPKLPRLTAAEAERVLLQAGFTFIRSKGSHRIYLKGGRIKCEVAVAKGKKLHDKRESERARTAEDEARAEMRRRA